MIKFNPVQIFKINNTISSQCKNNLKSIPIDTFTKSTSNISFKGINSSNADFCNWAKETKFLEQDLQKILEDKNNIIGSGFDHTVYSIPNCDDYVIRTNNFGCGMPLDYTRAEFSTVEYPEYEGNVGQPIVSIEIPCTFSQYLKDSVDILKKQSGSSIGIPPYEAISNENTGELRAGEAPYESYERKMKFLEDINKVSQLPQEAFDELLTEINNAAKAGYQLDHYNSNNLLLDEKNSRINLIDMKMSSKNLKPNYGNLLYSLTNIYYYPCFTSKYDGNRMTSEQIEQVTNNIVTIIDKLTTAMQKQGIKLDRNLSSVESRDFINSLPFSIYCQTNDYNEKWEKLEKLGLA